jgi:hypothetical protein
MRAAIFADVPSLLYRYQEFFESVLLLLRRPFSAPRCYRRNLKEGEQRCTYSCVLPHSSNERNSRWMSF